MQTSLCDTLGLSFLAFIPGRFSLQAFPPACIFPFSPLACVAPFRLNDYSLGVYPILSIHTAAVLQQILQQVVPDGTAWWGGSVQGPLSAQCKGDAEGGKSLQHKPSKKIHQHCLLDLRIKSGGINLHCKSLQYG